MQNFDFGRRNSGLKSPHRSSGSENVPVLLRRKNVQNSVGGQGFQAEPKKLPQTLDGLFDAADTVRHADRVLTLRPDGEE